MTKALIVQRLLDEQKITAEEAVTLLMATKEYVYPAYPVFPYNPYPYRPFYVDPFPGPYWVTYCTTTGTTSGSIVINDEQSTTTASL